MASRLKRLVNRKKDDVSGEQTSNFPGKDLSSVPYDGASTGQTPIIGSHPIRGSSEHTLSNFEPDQSIRKRRSKRFSQSSLPGFRSHLSDTDASSIPARQHEGIPHAEALYESRGPPTQNVQSNLMQQVHSSPRFHKPTVQPSPTTTDHQHYHHPGIRRVPPSRTPSHEPTGSNTYENPPDQQEIVDRAQYDSEEIGTAVTTAPAVTHEVVHQHIHHVREEQITREIHEHDVSHRMLPVVDVEVLPARHFLPAEGGGLVEIEADEAPGRGKHWIIAETASKIPSNQAVNTTPRQFSARTFKGTEGDAQRYQDPAGHLVTEQTWVHPPELETGARDTGQSWPLEFEHLSLKDTERPKSAGRRSGQRRSIERKPVGRQ